MVIVHVSFVVSSSHDESDFKGVFMALITFGMTTRNSSRGSASEPFHPLWRVYSSGTSSSGSQPRMSKKLRYKVDTYRKRFYVPLGQGMNLQRSSIHGLGLLRMHTPF